MSQGRAKISSRGLRFFLTLRSSRRTEGSMEMTVKEAGRRGGLAMWAGKSAAERSRILKARAKKRFAKKRGRPSTGGKK